jgi:hypothetical protein
LDIGRIPSLYVIGTEKFTATNHMGLTLRFNEPVDKERLFLSYEALVRKHETLRLRFVEAPWEQRFTWVPFSPRELDALLAEERLRHEHPPATAPRSIGELFSHYSPTNERLPIRFEFLDERTVLVFVNHALTSARGALYWVNEWLRLYGGAPDDRAPEERPPSISPWSRLARAVRGVSWTVASLAGSALRGEKAAKDTVDLTRGKSFGRHQKGYSIKTYHFSKEQTDQITRDSASRSLTISESLCAAVAIALFKAQPDKGRICISIPVDITRSLPGFSYARPGSYTGTIALQATRDADLLKQIRSGFKWAKRDVAYWMPQIFGWLSRSEIQVHAYFEQGVSLPIYKRAPFQNFSCAVSSVGKVQEPFLKRYLETISLAAGGQTILCGVASLNGRLSMEVCISNDLFDANEVFGVMDRLYEKLTQATRGIDP